MTNPIALMLQAMQGGMSPMQMIQQQAAQVPEFRQLQEICQGKSPEQLRQVAENMCRQRGTTYDALAQKICQTMGVTYK